MGKAVDKRVCRPRRPHHSVGRTAPALAVERTPWTPRFGCLRLPRSLIDCITTLMGLPRYYHGSTVANNHHFNGVADMVTQLRLQHISAARGSQRHCHSNGVANSTWVAKLFYCRYWGYIGYFNSSAVACDTSII